MSINPTFHQVCSSDFVTDNWISLLSTLNTLTTTTTDWRKQSSQRFRLLSTFCQMANTTVDDAVRRFNLRFLVGSNLFTENDFYTQLNTTISQFIQSTITDYSRLIKIVRLVTQVDQYYTGEAQVGVPNFNAAISLKNMINETSGELLPVVCYYLLKEKSFSPLFGVSRTYCRKMQIFMFFSVRICFYWYTRYQFDNSIYGQL
jgi:hypothetical protein